MTSATGRRGKQGRPKAIVSAGTPPARGITHKLSRSALVRVDAVYSVPSVHPKEPGPWADEADKIAWTDPMTGYGCIIRRSPAGGHLGGYVSVPPEHPLFGFDQRALVGLGLSAHGGISYAQPCQHWESEATSICHVTETQRDEVASQKVYANERAEHDDAWWFGFECDRPGDVLPNTPPFQRDPLLDGVNERVYRDEAYVYRQCVGLATQLKAIEDGRSPSEAGVPIHDVGYDPLKARG